MRRHWRVREVDGELVRSVMRRLDLPEVLARLLVARGHRDPEATERHLRASPMALHDPFLLPDMEAATERLARALAGGETILIHGDYDVDGVTGTALLTRLFRLLGARVAWHIPDRRSDGYSFGQHSIARAEATGARVVVSVDNGTSAHAVIGELAARGIDTIVTDHHEPPDGPLPEATAIVNPKLESSRYPWRELCGGAVAFKLAWGVAQRLAGGGRVRPDLKRFLEEAMAYVAIATVCDVVPLLDENRIFARFGLRMLETTQDLGLRALVDSAGLAGRPLSAEDVGFQIGPRINASGRLGSADVAVRLLLAQDAAEARELAERLDALNRERREVELAVLAEARAEALRHPDDPMLVLAGQGWHQGVVGIVAARLVDEHRRPALVIGLDGESGRGSARTARGCDLLAVLSGGAALMERYGGHAQAAGCEVRAANVEALRAALCARAHELFAAQPPAAHELLIDHELPFPEVTPHLMRHLDRLEPFGERNEKPLLLSRDLRLAEPPRTLGEDGRHLSLRLRQRDHVLRAMAFGQGPRAPELRMGTPIAAVYTPRWNTFRGATSLELSLVDFHAGL